VELFKIEAFFLFPLCDSVMRKEGGKVNSTTSIPSGTLNARRIVGG